MNCSTCGSEKGPFFNTMDLSKGQMQHICPSCIVKTLMDNPSRSDIHKLDQDIEEAMETQKSLQQIIDEHKGELDKYKDDPIMQFAFTPESSAALNNSFLIEMQEKKNTLLAAMPEKERLEYQLMQSLKSEDYESATEIREKLKETQ